MHFGVSIYNILDIRQITIMTELWWQPDETEGTCIFWSENLKGASISLGTLGYTWKDIIKMYLTNARKFGLH
jgi:hypothetical protein